jgi:hypothetical protein
MDIAGTTQSSLSHYHLVQHKPSVHWLGNEHVPCWWRAGVIAIADFEGAPFELRVLWELKHLLTKE